MSSFAPPVQRDQFVYQNGLFIDVALLRPSAPTPAPKDEVGHYYEAQLIHFELPRSKNKAVAKVRLLEALNKGSLKVPKDVASVEKELKKEWEALNRKAKKAFTTGRGGDAVVETKSTVKTNAKKKDVAATPPAVAGASAGRKRKVDAGANPSVKKETPTPAPAKKQKRDDSKTDAKVPTNPTPKPKKAPATTRGTASAPSSRGGKKPSAPRATVPPSAQLAAASIQNNVSAPPAPIQPRHTARRGGFRAAPTQHNVSAPPAPIQPRQTARRGGFRAAQIQHNVSAPPAPIQPRQTARRGGFRAAPHTRDYPNEIFPSYHDQDDLPPPYSENVHGSYGNSEPSDDADDASETSEAERYDNHSGIYNITCPLIESEWPDSIPDSGLQLKILYSRRHETYWGSYDLGVFSGAFHTATPEPREMWQGVYARFDWGGRENGEGEMSFGEGCTGFFKVRADGRVTGTFSGMYGDRVDFSGRRISARRAEIGTVAEFQEEFEGYNDDEYEEERTGRWGR